MKNVILFFLLFPIFCLGQNKGYIYYVDYTSTKSITYTKQYSESGSVYTTKYKIYDSYSNTNIIDIVATHYKDDKKIEVTCTESGGGILALTHTEKLTYTSVDDIGLNIYGITGAYRVLGGNSVPGQLLFKFVSNKYENIDLLEVLYNSISSQGSISFICLHV